MKLLAPVFLVAALGSTQLYASAPNVDEIINKTVAVMDRSPSEMTCNLHGEIFLFDASGKKEGLDVVEDVETRHGETTDNRLVKHVKDGRELTEAELDAERKRREQDKNNKNLAAVHLPYSQKWVGRYRFALKGEETLWGHKVYVVGVTALDRQPEALDGTSYIDSETFVVLKSEMVPAKMPDHVTWSKVLAQHTLLPSGYVANELLQLDGGAHYLIFKKGFRTVLKWRDCKVTKP